MASASKKLGNGIISREEVETWNLEALKDFCRCRGDKVIGSKEGLVFRAYILYNYCVLKGVKEEESTEIVSQYLAIKLLHLTNTN